MADKKMSRLSRKELLEMLIAQEKENARLQAKVDALQAKLNSRQIAIDKAGTLAEASLRLNGVFEAADAAVQQYLENIRRMNPQPQPDGEKDGAADGK